MSIYTCTHYGSPLFYKFPQVFAVYLQCLQSIAKPRSVGPQRDRTRAILAHVYLGLSINSAITTLYWSASRLDHVYYRSPSADTIDRHISVDTRPVSAEISVDTVSTVNRSSVGKMSVLGRYCQQYNDRYVSTNTDQLSAAISARFRGRYLVRIGRDTVRYSLEY